MNQQWDSSQLLCDRCNRPASQHTCKNTQDSADLRVLCGRSAFDVINSHVNEVFEAFGIEVGDKSK